MKDETKYISDLIDSSDPEVSQLGLKLLLSSNVLIKQDYYINKKGNNSICKNYHDGGYHILYSESWDRSSIYLYDIPLTLFERKYMDLKKKKI